MQIVILIPNYEANWGAEKVLARISVKTDTMEALKQCPLSLEAKSLSDDS